MKMCYGEIIQHVRANKPLQSTLVCLMKIFSAALLICVLGLWDFEASSPLSAGTVIYGWDVFSTAIIRLTLAVGICAVILAFEVIYIKIGGYERGLWPLLPILYQMQAISLVLFVGYLCRAEFSEALGFIQRGDVWNWKLASPFVHGLFMLVICISLTLDVVGRVHAWRNIKRVLAYKNNFDTWFSKWRFALGRAVTSCMLCFLVVHVMVITSIEPHPVLCIFCMLGAIAYLLMRYRRESRRIRSGEIKITEWSVLLILDLFAFIWLFICSMRCVLTLWDGVSGLPSIQNCLGLGICASVMVCIVLTRALTGRLCYRKK